MPRIIVTGIALLLFCHICHSQKLSHKQERWLYRIVCKTPVLKNNWATYFSFDQTPFTKDNYGTIHIDYDAIEYYQKHNPGSLQIDYTSIQKTSESLMAEAAIKLTLWELNGALKQCIYQHQDCNDSLYRTFVNPISKLLPERLTDKRKARIYNTVIHPSLPIFKKIKHLEEEKLTAETQKQVLNKWSELVADYSFERSQYFFKILTGGQELSQTTFLAAGEGSGTAGLLYEWETNPNDSTKRWYGKGIGLFTYKTRVYKNEIRLQPHVNKQLSIPKHQSIALHTSLWGLDSSLKPILIVTDDTVSYHLFADFLTKGITPDKAMSNGISHNDRIEEYRQQHIVDAMNKIQGNELLNKAYQSKKLIEKELTLLESEIDTLRKNDPDNVEAINYRKRLIDGKLSNMSKKDKRINELEQNIAAQYKEIDKARKKLDKMIQLLGPNPQQWVNEGDIFKFSSGVIFNPATQDLIFPKSDHQRELEIRLVSAGYTLEGSRKDEVQAYVSLTNVKEQKTIPKKIKHLPIDTTLKVYFHPDEFLSNDKLSLSDVMLKKIRQYECIKLMIGKAEIPDSIRSNSSNYTDRSREYLHPRTLNAQNRFAEIQFTSDADTLTISALASADPVPTRLSKATKQLKEDLNINKSSVNNNRYLTALRAISTIKEVLKLLDFKLADLPRENLSINLEISEREFNVIKQSLIHE